MPRRITGEKYLFSIHCKFGETIPVQAGSYAAFTDPGTK